MLHVVCSKGWATSDPLLHLVGQIPWTDITLIGLTLPPPNPPCAMLD